jgi:protein-S-isoprenylcysteine O-methyltransferase Ste14
MKPPLTAPRLAAKLAAALMLFALVLLIPARTWRWAAAWVYIGLYLAFAIPVGLWLLRTNPALLAERLDWAKRAPKAWDRALMAGLIPMFVCLYVLSGLDFRFGWSEIPLAARAVSFVLIGAFYALMYLVLRENAFLSRVVEVHPEAGHRVVSTGPYGVVRHPMYAGYIVWVLAGPLALGSLPALVPAGLIVAGVVTRTVLEDRSLRAELQGYAEYAARIRFRLLPGVF